MVHVGTLANVLQAELQLMRKAYQDQQSDLRRYAEGTGDAAVVRLVEEFTMAHQRYLEVLHVWDHLRGYAGIETRVRREAGGG